jgi:hypothetical protein
VLEERINRIASQVLGDASLTDEMDDVEARLLFDWAARAARRIAEQAEAMSDAEAERYLESAIPDLRKVLRRINKMVGMLASSSPDEAASALDKVFEAASSLPVLKADRPDSVRQIASGISRQSRKEALGQVLSHIRLEREQAAAPEASSAVSTAQTAAQPTAHVESAPAQQEEHEGTTPVFDAADAPIMTLPWAQPAQPGAIPEEAAPPNPPEEPPRRRAFRSRPGKPSQGKPAAAGEENGE